MPTYSLRTRILSSNPYKNLYTNNNNYKSNNYESNNYETNNNSSNYWILIILLIILTLIAIFVGSIYNTHGYYNEGFQDGESKLSGNNHTLYFFYMDKCKWCDDFKNGAWEKLKVDMKTNPKEYLFKIDELNISSSDEKANRLGQKYNVNSTPTLILVDNSDENKYEIFDRDRNMIDDLKKFGNKKNN